MEHDQAINFLIERLLKQFPDKTIFKEKTFRTKPRIVPDISIDLGDGKRWIVVEVGATHAKKVGLYRQDPRIEKFLWYDNETLKLVGVWDFRGHEQEVTVEDEITNRSQELYRLGQIKKQTEQSIKGLQKLEENLNHETYGFLRDHKLRVLCPRCLTPIPFSEATAWFHGNLPHGMIACKSCKNRLDVDPITNANGAHPVVQVWNSMIEILEENKIEDFSQEEFEDIFRRGVESFTMSADH